MLIKWMRRHNGSGLPHGVLFRGSSEGVIRQYLIEQMNVVDAIIGLPAIFSMARLFRPVDFGAEENRHMRQHFIY